ncbi:MAG: tRNA (adenosine(37)-N6)-dimethylallyltransferase MiaA, partial [Firmicutes bacterium]|nr:tRNA (adenosine(37)-N6)-dimethylallyltransferase MiaA [Bacillota bacterium]
HPMLKLAAIVGPTAVGKTELSIGLAQKFGGEIISCDSMQVYRGLDLGTAKATPAERKLIPHHLIDIVEPNEDFTVADYQKRAQTTIKDISRRGRLPILVGGTGLYYQAVVDNYDFFPMESRAAVRQKWEQVHAERGLAHLYARVLDIDKEYALKIGQHDKKRIIRALEVYDLTGLPFSESQTRNRHTYHLAAVGLYLERVELYARIEARVDRMIAAGLVHEVERLMAQGYDLSLNAMQALGYKQIYSYLEGWLTWQETLQEIKKETRRYSKRQYTWFNKDQRIQWINVADYTDNSLLLEKICEIMEGQWGTV